MISRILPQAGRFAAMGLAGTGAVMCGTEVATGMNLFKKDGFPTVLKVVAVGGAAILGGVFSPVYVPVRVYQLSRNQ